MVPPDFGARCTRTGTGKPALDPWPEMWFRLILKLGVPEQEAENLLWTLGREEISRRAGVPEYLAGIPHTQYNLVYGVSSSGRPERQ